MMWYLKELVAIVPFIILYWYTWVLIEVYILFSRCVVTIPSQYCFNLLVQIYLKILDISTSGLLYLIIYLFT